MRTAKLNPQALIIAEVDFTAPSPHVARQLIGITLLIDGVGGRIVETEAYDVGEGACHAFAGLNERNATLFGPPGHAYVYRSYGIHWCLNFVCRGAGHAAGVLIRALEPTHRLDRMSERRGLHDPRLLCAGPGRVGQALGIDRSYDGMRLDAVPFSLLGAPHDHPPPTVVEGPRIGITKATTLPWRFGERGSRFLSKQFAH
jgi:DNA-3-methyladenine glycosylase